MDLLVGRMKQLLDGASTCAELEGWCAASTDGAETDAARSPGMLRVMEPYRDGQVMASVK